MPVFISYSHQDREFADTLAIQLVRNRVNVWLDKWELRVGDSLLERIQTAIQGSSALLVVLSKASVQSAWCRRELNAGLTRELEERQVVLLPLLLEDCEVPLFLRDKLYADFRTNFDDGLRAVLEGVAAVTNADSGRVEHPGFHMDWSFDWGSLSGRFYLRVTIIEQGPDRTYTMLSEIVAAANDKATGRYLMFEQADLGWAARQVVVEALSELSDHPAMRVLVDDSQAQTRLLTLDDPRTGIAYDVTVTVRRLGNDSGKDTLLDVGSQIAQIQPVMKERTRPLTADEQAQFIKILGQTV